MVVLIVVWRVVCIGFERRGGERVRGANREVHREVQYGCRIAARCNSHYRL